jgi:hypothetical protein
VSKLRTHPKEGKFFLLFNRFKFNMIAGYNCSANVTGGRHENGVGKYNIKKEKSKGVQDIETGVRGKKTDSSLCEALLRVLALGRQELFQFPD